MYSLIVQHAKLTVIKLKEFSETDDCEAGLQHFRRYAVLAQLRAQCTLMSFRFIDFQPFAAEKSQISRTSQSMC